MNTEALLHSNNWFNYQEFYRYISERPDFSTFVEVGVWKGHSLTFLANLLRGRSVRIFAVDLWNESYDLSCGPEVSRVYGLYQENVLRAGVRDMIEDVHCDSTEAAARFANGFFDFAFLDADHSYERVRADIAAWWPKVRAGGILGGHDYADDCGVKRAVNEFFGAPLQAPGRVWYVHC